MPTRTVTRGVLRLPNLLHRLGRGELLGPRIVLLEHIGRRSGRSHRTPLEVVERPADGELVVVAGLGERADWLRNVRARPEAHVHEGRGPGRPVRAEILDADETTAWMDGLRRARPLSYAVMSGILWVMVLGLLGPTTRRAPRPVVVRFVDLDGRSDDDA